MLGLKLNHVSKRGHSKQLMWYVIRDILHVVANLVETSDVWSLDKKCFILTNENILFLRDIHTKSWYGHAGVLDDFILSGFRCAFSCMVQYSLCHGMDIATCDIVHWSAAPHHRIAYRTVFWVNGVLVLNVIRCSCRYFLDRILFHRDFHHDSCDYHSDFYGH